MRFLLPIIIVGALLASQFAFAEGNKVLPTCRTKAMEHRAKRMLRAKRLPSCLFPGAAGTSSSSSISFVSPASSLSSSAAFSISSAPLDALTDTVARSQFLLFGETGPIVGSAAIFMDLEPLSVTSISIGITTEVTGLYSFLLYDADRRLLGTARLDASVPSRRIYKLAFVSGKGPEIAKRQEYRFYARPVLLSKDLGALSNQMLEINQFVVEGNGVWSSDKYTKSTTDTFPAFVTARSVIVSAKNALAPSGGLSAGVQRTIGSFVFQSRTTDPSPHIAIESLNFDLSLIGGVTVSNVTLGADGAESRVACSLLSSGITCAVPDTHGRLDSGPRTVTLYGDIDVPGGQNPSVRATLNNPGSIASPGAVTWSDGSNSFQWLPVDSPVADGTLWK